LAVLRTSEMETTLDITAYSILKLYFVVFSEKFMKFLGRANVCGVK
jgi:hypothetical protein